jgi:hypothetical protein
MSIAPNFRILCLFSVFLLCSKLGIAAQAQNDPEPTCKIHFQIFPKALAEAERFTMQYLVAEADTSQAVHDEFIISALPNLSCQIFGLPVGQYQFTRTEFENPESAIDQCTVYVSK